MLQESEVQKLISESIQGNSESFGRIYDEYSQRIFNFILSRVRHKSTAEDLLHTVFLKAWTNLPRYRPNKRAKFSTWLFQIANYTVIDHWRTAKETVELEKIENLSELALNPNLYESYDYLWKAIVELPDDYRSVLHLRFIEDLSVSEAAWAMDKSEVGIRVLQHRALKALKKILSKNGHGII